MTVEEVLEQAKAKGVLIYPVDHAIDMDEPLLGREAREVLDNLSGHNGTFRTIQALTYCDVVELAGVTDEEEVDTLSDELDPEYELVFEAPAGYTGDTVTTLVFQYAKAANSPAS